MGSVRRRFSGLSRRRRRYPTMDSRGRPLYPSPPTNSLIPSRSLRPSFYLSTRVIPHAWLRGAAHAQATRTGDLVSWLTREIRRSRRRRSANRGERMSGREGEKGARGLQLSQILRHLPRTRSTGHSDPLNPGSTTCLSPPCTSLQPSLLPLPPSFCCPSQLPRSVPPPPGIKS